MLDVAMEQDAAVASTDPLEQTVAATPRWSFSRAGTSERPNAEAFIRQGFERAYSCRLEQLMPELMVLRHGSKVAAACGLRPAPDGKLFLEIYLDDPVESVLSEAAGAPIARGDITEVGNLVIARPGHARRLIVHLSACLHARGCKWVVFSAVPALRNNFLRIGIPLVTLAPADANRLSAEERAPWGNYYDHSPVVTAVNVAAAFDAVCEAACTR
jgi:hypothetical protein